jgi:hypothetical protein
MSTWNHNWLLLARGGMELSWRYALALFAALLAVQLTFPLPAAVCAMVLGAVVTRMSIAGNFRIYQKIAFQSACFVLISLLTLYWTQYPGVPFWHFDWTRHLLLEAKSPFQWLILFVLVFYMWLFWQGGRLLIKGSQHYMPICMHFDRDLGLFMALLIVYALVDVRTELNLQNQGIRFTILAFFTFSLASIVLARHQTHAQKSFVSGYHGIGMILSTLTMTGIFAIGTTLLAYPYLFHKADALLIIIKKTAAPFKPLLINILLFLFRPRQLKEQADIQNKNMPSIKEMGAPVVEDWQTVLIKILGVCLIALIGLVILVLLGFLVYKLVLWLSKKDRNAAEPIHLFKGFRRFLKACRVFLLRIWEKTMELVKGMDSAAMIYYRLLRWGGYSGMTPLPSDTPSEYGSRLMQSFPGLKSEIHLIVEAFNREIYGRTATDRQTLVQLASAYRRMRGLKHWPSRMKTWFYQSK